MTDAELKALLGNDTAFPLDEDIGDLKYMTLDSNSPVLLWETAIDAGSDELTNALNTTIKKHVRSAIILAFSSLSVFIDEKGVTVYTQPDKEDLLVVPWQELLHDYNGFRDEGWREEIIKVIKAKTKQHNKREKEEET